MNSQLNCNLLKIIMSGRFDGFVESTTTSSNTAFVFLECDSDMHITVHILVQFLLQVKSSQISFITWHIKRNGGGLSWHSRNWGLLHKGIL